MIKKIVIVFIIILTIGLVFYYNDKSKEKSVTKTNSISETSIQQTKITAEFKIITNGFQRIFSDSKYHNLSDGVYTTSKDPNKIEVRKENITWSDFFKTLPMSLDKNCLVTGTKQTFCTNENKKLYFYINNTETPDALDNPIQDNDFLLVEYK